MTMAIRPDQRADILRYAAGLLPGDDRADPALVAAAAIPLLEWAEQAADEDDLRYRMRAMSQQHTNQRAAGSPDRFVEDAGMLHAVIAAGRD